MSLKCAYHPEREASDKCEKCGKVICVECKTVIHETHGTGENRYSTRHEICIPCSYDREISRYGVGQNIVAFSICIIFISIFVGMTTYANIAMGSFNLIFFPIIGIIILIILTGYFIYWMAVKRSKGIAKVKIQKEEFLNSLKQSSKIDDKATLKIFCHECGNQIAPNDSICSYCGTVVKDES